MMTPRFLNVFASYLEHYAPRSAAGAARSWLTAALLLLAGMMVPGFADAQTWQNCTINVSVGENQTLSRDALADCPRGVSQPNSYVRVPYAGFGTIPQHGTVQPNPNDFDDGQYRYTPYGGFRLIYTPDPASGGLNDVFDVSIFDETRNDYYLVTYNVSITPASAPPTLSGASPLAGTVAGGTLVTLTGNNFISGMNVTVGGNPGTSVTVSSTTSLTFRTPAGSAGAKNIVVTSSGGTATLTGGFSYVEAPQLAAAFSPSTIAAGATATLNLTISNPPGNSVSLSGLQFSANLPGNLSGMIQSSTCGGTLSLNNGTVSLSNGSALSPGSSCAIAVQVTPGGSGTYSLTTGTISASGPTALTGSAASASLTVNAPTITVSPASLTNATVGASYSTTISGSGGTAPYSFAVTSGALPAGIILAGNGTLSGVPTAGGAFSFTITATDQDSYSGQRSYSLTVAAPSIAFAASGALPDATRNVSYSQTLSASGGSVPYSYAVTGGALPAGLTLAANGTISGTPTGGGTANFTVTATDSSTGSGPYTGSESYSITVTVPAVSLAPSTIPGATRNVSYSQALSATGGSGPYTYSISSGALPAGMTLSGGGVLSGTPTAAGSFIFTATATDQNGNSGNRAYTLTVSTPAIALSPASLNDGRVGDVYSATLTASGGAAPYSFALVSGALPPGVTFSSGGALSGTPTAGGTFNLVIRATDANANSGDQAYALTVLAPAINIAPATLPDATLNAAYNATITASGGTVGYSYSIASGALPTGLTLSASGALSGTPTQSGDFAFAISASDSSTGTGPYSGARSYTLTVAVPTIAVTPANIPGATTNVAYSQSLSAGGGTGPYSYAVTSGALPSGISLSGSGMLSGAAATSGSFTFTVTATDANNNSGTQAYTLAVSSPTIALNPTTLPDATINAAYSQSLSANGGAAPYSYGVTSGTLPSGVSLSSGGLLSGAPVTSGSFGFTVTVTDANGNSGIQAYTLAVSAPTIALSPTTLGNGVPNAPYSASISASGGTAPYSYAVSAGALPSGLSLGTDGTLAGTPVSAGTYNFTITASDANSNSGARSYTIDIVAPTIALTPDMLDDGILGTAYSVTLSASGGVGPYGYSIASGALPAGLTLSGDGLLSGTPTAAGSFGFTLSAADANGNAGTKAYSIAIVSPQVNVTPAALPDGSVGTAYSQPLSATGGTAPYSYAVSTGTLPAGLTLAGNGTLSGTPDAAGSVSFTVTATDAFGTSGAVGYTLTIAKAAQTISFTAPADIALGSGPVTLVAAASSGLPVSFVAATPSVCTVAGDQATLVASGTCTIEAQQAGNENIAAAPLVSRSFTITAAGLVAVQPQAPVTGTVGQQLTPVQPVTASGGTKPYAYALSAALPSGLEFSPSTGVLSGTPVADAENVSVTVTVTDAAGQSAQAGFTITIAAPAITLSPESLPDGKTDEAYSAAIVATGGTAPYRYAVTGGALPAGLNLAADGAITGQPVDGGSFDFSVTATDSSSGTGPFSATRAYRITVALPPPEVLPVPEQVAASATTSASQPLTLNLNDYITGDFDSVELVRQAMHGTVTLISPTQRTAGIGTAAASGFVARYEPEVGFVGQDGFDFVAVGPGGTSAPATVTVTVRADVPVAVNLSANAEQSSPVTILLTEGASGGPFTAATIVSVTPSDSISTRIEARGEGSYALIVTPAPTFAGLATVGYTLTNVAGTSAVASVSVTVAARPDPTADPTVAGVSAAQAESARRLAAAQLSNFQRRNEQLHNGGQGSGGMSSSVQLTGGTPAWQREAEANGWSGQTAMADPAAVPAVAGRAVVRGDAETNRGGVPAKRATDPADTPAAEDNSERTVGSAALWVGGSVLVGTRDADAGRDRLRLSSEGLSLGVDVKLNDRLIIGLGGGYGRSVTKVGRDDAGRVRAAASSASLYGSWSPAPAFFVDGVLGIGDLDYRIRRSVTANGLTADAVRSGELLFGSLSGGIDRTMGRADISLYGKLDWVDATLNSYFERGGGTYSLAFAKRDLSSIAGVLGGRGSLNLGAVRPQLRLEWRHEFRDSAAQLLDYADVGAYRYRLNDEAWLMDSFTGEVGVELLLGRGWSSTIDLGGGFGSGATYGTAGISVARQF
ncbi:uncharacterized protein YhjY with autotransporter beta-barrel domain [Stakelama pacifica]|uniref:Uncharacterized protein YhjY with autotransporter beta-barrel domain n=3 Tax=Stakelama pacifica TaxID=517720 RepID=A0A4R6FCZ0_9SPHN|nr:uncharacterized protein YhjY with autotransporter beta-barrel domain [Stakelama pacifica]